MKYVSRRYLSEKWTSLKWDMEGLLTGDSDEVNYAEVEKRLPNIIEMMSAILTELGVEVER